MYGTEPSSIQIFQGFGPAYGGDEFVRLKEIPPAVVAARASGRWIFFIGIYWVDDLTF